MTDASMGLLSRLWLREPDALTLDECREIPSLAPHAGEPSVLPAAYADLFLLNVYPYGTAFTDPSGELNGSSAAQAATLYEEKGFRPPEIFEVGAPDHVGLGLAFLDHLERHGEKDAAFSCSVLDWVPVACLAVEREPSAHPFYRAVAAVTRERLLEGFPCHSDELNASPRHSEERSDEESVFLPKGPQIPRSSRDDAPMGDEEEIGLSGVVRFLLAPARSGLFLSRTKLGQLARTAGLRLPFASRFDVARLLLQAAGQGGKVDTVLDLLGEEVGAWETAYRSWADEYPRWAPAAARWLGRAGETRRRLGEMRATLRNPPELEYAEDS